MSSIKVDKEIQTDAEKFFSYILDFLSHLEARIANGDLSVEDVLEEGRQLLYNRRKSSRWSYDTPSPSKARKKDSQAVKELQQCLAKIKSIRAYGGDVFFVGLAKVFAAQPIVPLTFDETASARKTSDERQRMTRSANRA